MRRTFSAATRRGGAQFLDAQRALILAVEGNLFVLAGRQAQHFEGEEFEGAQQFSAAIEQEGGVGAGEVDENFRLLPVAVLGQRRIDDDPVFEAESAVGDDGLEEGVDLIGGGEFVGNGHGVGLLAISSWLSAESGFSGDTLAFNKSLSDNHSQNFPLFEIGAVVSQELRANGQKLTATSLSSWRAWPCISRISRPSDVRFMTACCAIRIKLDSA